MWKPSQARIRRERKRGTNLFTGINVAGLAGILVALFFALLVHSAFSPDLRKVAAVDLPRVKNATWQPKALREDVMWIVVTRDGGLFFRHNRIQVDEIPDAIRAAVRDGSERKVYLSVDTHGRYAEVKAVLGQIRRGGVSDVVFLAEESIRPKQ
jgi:biopolymer transport protein ExbD